MDTLQCGLLWNFDVLEYKDQLACDCRKRKICKSNTFRAYAFVDLINEEVG